MWRTTPAAAAAAAVLTCIEREARGAHLPIVRTVQWWGPIRAS